MGLYWIRPYKFINLDSRNRKFLCDPENLSADIAAEVVVMTAVPTAEKYLDFGDKCKNALQKGIFEYKTFPELSYTAWITSKGEEESERNARGSFEDLDSVRGVAESGLKPGIGRFP